MEHTYNYAVLQVIPDARRGERVNIGIVVFGPDGADIRVSESRKLRALSLGAWDSEIDSYSSALRKLDTPSADIEERLENISVIENQFSAEKRGWFLARNKDEYENSLDEIIKTLVTKPTARRQREASSVVAEISGALRKADILAGREEAIDSGKVVRNYRISEELEADFAQLNSQFHVAAVLDLRATTPRLAQAALKAVVLDRAEAAHPNQRVHKIGVWAAAPARMDELQHNLAILKPYTDHLVNWDDPSDRRGLQRIFYDAYNAHNPHPIN
jgi:hypothetical protein